jgi:hypothetical protein
VAGSQEAPRPLLSAIIGLPITMPFEASAASSETTSRCICTPSVLPYGKPSHHTSGKFAAVAHGTIARSSARNRKAAAENSDFSECGR